MAGIRRSRQREVILKELKSVTSHPTAVELHELVRKEVPNISLGTIYRNLELLSDNRTIQKLEISGAQARFDGNPDWHLHVHCPQCDRVSDIHNPPPGAMPPLPAELAGHEILGLCIEYIGICPACSINLSPRDREALRQRKL